MTELASTTTVFTSHDDATPEVPREQLVQLGLWMFLATVTMLFAAFTSAYLVRRAGADWRPIDWPWLLWVNTVVLAASSVGVEVGRRAAEAARWSRARSWFAAAILLGVLFLGGQLVAWQSLVDRGVLVQTLPQSSFFYLLTGVHALHLLAGLIVLVTTLPRLRATAERPSLDVVSPAGHARLAATFWHFFGAVWLYLLVLLYLF